MTSRAAVIVASLGFAVPAVSRAASVELSYDTVQISTNVGFALTAPGAVRNITIGPDNLVTVPEGRWVRFNVRATVTNNPNSLANIVLGAVGGQTQPSTLGVSGFGAWVTNTNVAIAAPVTAPGGATRSRAAVNPNFSSDSYSGLVNATTGNVGVGLTSDAIRGSIVPESVNGLDAASVSKLTTGTTSTAAGDALFAGLSFYVPEGVGNTSTRLTTLVPSGRLSFVTPGSNVGSAPAYTARAFASGDSVTGPGTIVIYSGTGPTALNTSDPAGTSSFNTGPRWSDSASPAVTKDYLVRGGTLRTPVTGTIAFPGRSLMLGTGGELVLENVTLGSTVVNALTLNGGRISNGGSNNTAASQVTLGGDLSLINAGGTLDSGAAGRTLTIASAVSGDAPVTIAGAGSVVVRSAAYSTFLSNVGGVSLANAGGTLVLDYTGNTSPIAAVQSLLNAAAPTNFTKGQVRASLAAGQTVGYGDNGTNRLTVRITLAGDSDLDGDVDFNDFLVLQNNFGNGNTRFDQGNFNYDGFTDFNDFLALQNNFGQSVNPALLPSVTAAERAAVLAIATSGQVPEPAALALLGGAAILLGRRRR